MCIYLADMRRFCCRLVLTPSFFMWRWNFCFISKRFIGSIRLFCFFYGILVQGRLVDVGNCFQYGNEFRIILFSSRYQPAAVGPAPFCARKFTNQAADAVIGLKPDADPIATPVLNESEYGSFIPEFRKKQKGASQFRWIFYTGIAVFFLRPFILTLCCLSVIVSSVRNFRQRWLVPARSTSVS